MTASRDEPLVNRDEQFPGASSRVSAADSVLLLLGDSHARRLLEGLVPEARGRGVGVSYVGLGGCPGVPSRAGVWGDDCEAMADATFSSFLPDPAVKVIVLAARGAFYLTGNRGATAPPEGEVLSPPRETRLRELQDGYAVAIRWIEAAGKQLVLVLDVPELDFEPLYCLSQRSLTMLIGQRCATSRQTVDGRQRDYRSLVQRLQGEFPRLIVFDPVPLLCDRVWCYARRERQSLYDDNNHLSAEGSRLVAASLAGVISWPPAPRS